MSDHDLRAELQAATDRCRKQAQVRADARQKVIDARKALKREAGAYDRACLDLQAVADEILSGQLRLPFERANGHAPEPNASTGDPMRSPPPATNGNGHANANGHPHAAADPANDRPRRGSRAPKPRTAEGATP